MPVSTIVEKSKNKFTTQAPVSCTLMVLARMERTTRSVCRHDLDFAKQGVGVPTYGCSYNMITFVMFAILLTYSVPVCEYMTLFACIFTNMPYARRHACLLYEANAGTTVRTVVFIHAVIQRLVGHALFCHIWRAC